MLWLPLKKVILRCWRNVTAVTWSQVKSLATMSKTMSKEREVIILTYCKVCLKTEHPKESYPFTVCTEELIEKREENYQKRLGGTGSNEWNCRKYNNWDRCVNIKDEDQTHGNSRLERLTNQYPGHIYNMAVRIGKQNLTGAVSNMEKTPSA